MCDWATRCSTDQVQVNPSTWYPIATQVSSSFLPTTDSELTMSSGGTKPGKEDSSPQWREGGGMESLCQAPKTLCPTIFLEWFGDSWLSSIRSPLLKTVDGASTWCNPDMGLRPSPGCIYACHKYAPKSCGYVNLKMASTMESEGRKQTTSQTTPYTDKSVGGLNFEKELTCWGAMVQLAYAWKDIWNWGSCCGTVVRPTTPHVPLRISCGSRSTSCWAKASVWPKGAIITSGVTDEALQHTIIRDEVVVVTWIWDIMHSYEEKQLK